MDQPASVLRRTAAGPVAASRVTGPDEAAHERRHLVALPPIGMVSNPRSHRNRGHAPDWARFPGVLVASPRDRTELARALAQFASANIGILVIDGGDGTVREVLTRGGPVFGENWPRLVLLPKGKTNALAVDLGVPRAWTFAAAIQAAHAGRVVARRPIVIERGAGEPALWGFIFGAGAFNAAIDTGQLAHRFGAFQGLAVGMTATLGCLTALFGVGDGPWRRTAPMRLTHVSADPRTLAAADLPHSGRGDPAKRYLALFSTLRRFPIGIAPFRKDERDIRFLLIDAPLRRVMARLPAILAGVERPNYAALGIHRGFATGFDMLLDDRFVLDGEAFPPGRLRLRQGPELQFVVP